MTDKNGPVFLVTGLGEGTGGAAARRFSKGGYRVAMLCRSEHRLNKFEAELPGSKGYPCDVADLEHLAATIDQIREEMGGGKGTRQSGYWEVERNETYYNK